jgi:hypothetical protein
VDARKDIEQSKSGLEKAGLHGFCRIFELASCCADVLLGRVICY